MFGVVLFLALMLVVLISDLYALASHHPAPADIYFWDYALAVLYVYLAVVVCRDSKLRKNHPFGVAGMGLMMLVLLVRIVAHWDRGSSHEAQIVVGTSIKAIGVASSALLLTEGVRWLKRKVTLT